MREFQNYGVIEPLTSPSAGTYYRSITGRRRIDGRTSPSGLIFDRDVGLMTPMGRQPVASSLVVWCCAPSDGGIRNWHALQPVKISLTPSFEPRSNELRSRRRVIGDVRLSVFDDATTRQESILPRGGKQGGSSIQQRSGLSRNLRAAASQSPQSRTDRQRDGRGGRDGTPPPLPPAPISC